MARISTGKTPTKIWFNLGIDIFRRHLGILAFANYLDGLQFPKSTNFRGTFTYALRNNIPWDISWLDILTI